VGRGGNSVKWGRHSSRPQDSHSTTRFAHHTLQPKSLPRPARLLPTTLSSTAYRNRLAMPRRANRLASTIHARLPEQSRLRSRALLKPVEETDEVSQRSSTHGPLRETGRNHRFAYAARRPTQQDTVRICIACASRLRKLGERSAHFSTWNARGVGVGLVLLSRRAIARNRVRHEYCQYAIP